MYICYFANDQGKNPVYLVTQYCLLTGAQAKDMQIQLYSQH